MDRLGALCHGGGTFQLGNGTLPTRVGQERLEGVSEGQTYSNLPEMATSLANEPAAQCPLEPLVTPAAHLSRGLPRARIEH